MFNLLLNISVVYHCASANRAKLYALVFGKGKKLFDFFRVSFSTGDEAAQRWEQQAPWRSIKNIVFEIFQILS